MKKFLITLAVFVVMAAAVIGLGAVAAPGSAAVGPLGASSLCPVAGCAMDGACHDYASVPVPDGAHEMACPEASCASTECHAWDSLTGRYHQASDASLNLWIVLPVVLVLVLVVVARKVDRREEA